MKILITENQLNKLYFKFLNYLFKDIYEVELEYYPDTRFWKKDDNMVLELEKSGRLYVLHTIWNDISSMLSLDYDETEQLIKEWVEQHLKLEEFTPNIPIKTDKGRWNNI